MTPIRGLGSGPDLLFADEAVTAVVDRAWLEQTGHCPNGVMEYAPHAGGT
jgi:hypothetical protein